MKWNKRLGQPKIVHAAYIHNKQNLHDMLEQLEKLQTKSKAKLNAKQKTLFAFQERYPIEIPSNSTSDEENVCDVFRLQLIFNV